MRSIVITAVLLACSYTVLAQTSEDNAAKVSVQLRGHLYTFYSLVACLISKLNNQFLLILSLPQVAELLELQQNSKDGVILLDNSAFVRYTSGKNRPYSLFLFGDSRQFRKQSKLELEGRYQVYASVARAFTSHHSGKLTEGKAFFARMFFEDAKESFGRLGVKGLPYISRVPPALLISPNGGISMPKGETLSGGVSTGLDPKDIGDFVEDRTGLSPGDLAALTATTRSRFIPLFTLIFLAGASFVGYKLYYAKFMRSRGLYAAGALAIFWFATSGGMYNIIRGAPFIGYDARTRSSVLFTSGSGQMGAEGFIMGTFYILFALLITSFTKLLPTVKEESERRLRGWVILGAAVVVLRVVLGNHAWKSHINSFYYF
jgi:oligosaccharyltransferase complex subunit gamma